MVSDSGQYYVNMINTNNEKLLVFVLFCFVLLEQSDGFPRDFKERERERGGRQTDRQTEKERHIQRERERQTDRQTDRQKKTQ